MFRTKEFIAPGLIDPVRQHRAGIAAKFPFVILHSGLEVAALIAEYGNLWLVCSTCCQRIFTAVSRCARLLFSRSMSVGYLMSAGATVASSGSFPRFFFRHPFFFFDVFAFAFPFCLDALDPRSSSPLCGAGGSFSSSSLSFRFTFLCPSGHFPVQTYSLIFATSSTGNHLRKCTIMDGSNNGSA